MSEPAKVVPINPAAAPAAATAAAKPAPQTISLAKGDMLFNEGDTSRSMYFLKSGMIRIFKRKGDAQIELDTIHAGTLLGELAFLDGNPRSASGEALVDSQVVEISGAMFASVLGGLPDWMKLLLKTLVGRLRSSSTRLKQLEEASTTYDYSSKDGKKGPTYIYINTTDAMKMLAAIVLVGAKNGQPEGTGVAIRQQLVMRYANQISQVPVAKVTDFLGILHDAEVLINGEAGDTNKIVLKDLNFIEKLVAFMNEENLKESAKRRVVSQKGFAIWSMIVKHMGSPPKDGEGNATVNLAEIKKADAAANGGKERFRLEEFEELVKAKYCSQAQVKSNDEMKTTFHFDTFMAHFKYWKVLKTLERLNEDKVNKKK
jgi:CRP-like cAMP-binding protein